MISKVAVSNQYHYRTYNTNIDLAQGKISALLQCRDGNIWLGTPAGLVRFNGITSTYFNRQNIPVLSKDAITVLYQDNKDILWIGTEGGGLICMKKNLWKKFSFSEGLSDLHIRCITCDWYGQLWVGTDYGLNCINDDTIKVFTTEDGLYDNIITAITIDIQGDLLIGTFRSGLLRYSDGISQVYGYADGLTSLSVTALLTDRSGRIWIGTLGGLFYLALQDRRVYKVPGTSGIPVTGVMQDSQGKIWYSSMINGLVQINRHEKVHIDLADNFVHCLIEDNSGTLWAGTDAAGLIQVKKSYISNITRDDGLPDNVITALYLDNDKNIWAGTRNDGLIKIKNNRILKIYNQNSGLFSNRITAVHRDHNDNLWIGSADSGLFILSGIRVIETEITDKHITTIFQEDDKSVWIGTTQGVYLYRNSNLISSFLANRRITSIVRDENKRILVSSDSGIFIYSANKMTLVTNTHSFNILCLHSDNHGRLWVGTNGTGIYILQGDEIYQIDHKNGLPDNYIFSITPDDNGNLWCTSYKGIFVLDKADLNQFLAKTISYIIPHWYNVLDGMSSSQCQPADAFFCDTKFYVATKGGISIFEPDVLFSDSYSPLIHIEKIRSERGDENLTDEILELPAACKFLEIRLTAFDYRAPDKLHFRYKLEGYDTTFIYALPRQNLRVTYQNLAAGRYCFIAQATRLPDQWSQPEVRLSVIIPPPFYTNNLFIIGIILLLTGTVLSIILINNYRKRRKLLNKYKTVILDPERTEKAIHKLEMLMVEKKLYLNPDLTLRDLARELHLHYNHLSRILNEKFKLGYNDFINEFRIRDAMKILSDPTQKDQTILQIMYKTGFYSKSVFNTAFKKFSGKTPSEYRRERLAVGGRR